MCDSLSNISNSIDTAAPTTGSTPTKCTICHKYYKNMAAHLKDHKRERKFECDYCHRRFVWKYKLIPHMDVHVAGQRFKCSYCPRGFSFKSSLEYHLRSHTNQNVHLYQCEFCGKEFKYPHTLTTHLRTHTKEKPYKCTMCEKSYSQFVSLQHHIMIHNGQKPYHCDICGKGFSDLTGVKLHKRTHTNESPFICHLCGKATKTIGNLKSHYSYVHKIKDITGPTIQNNSKIFAKYSAEELKTIGLLEILSREAMANVLKQECRVEDNLVFSRGPKANTNTISNLNNSLSEPSSQSRNFVLDNENSPTNTNSEHPQPLVTAKENQKHEQHSNQSNVQKKENRLKHDQTFASAVFIKSESGEIEDYNDDSALSAPYDDPVSSMPTDDYTEMIVDVKPVLYFDEENTPSGSDVKAETVKDPNVIKPELNFLVNDCDSQLTSSGSTTKTDEKTAKNKPKRNRQKREGDLFTCDICNKSYKKKDHLKGHIITHSEKNFICEQCGNKFHNTSNLRRHVRLRHSNDRPFACHLCVFRTKTNYSLKVHLRSHFNEKIFKCMYCDKCFSGSTNRDSHQRSHTGEKPYKCQFCGKFKLYFKRQMKFSKKEILFPNR